MRKDDLAKMEEWWARFEDDGGFSSVFVALFVFIVSLPLAYGFLYFLEVVTSSVGYLHSFVGTTPLLICVALFGGVLAWRLWSAPKNEPDRHQPGPDPYSIDFSDDPEDDLSDTDTGDFTNVYLQDDGSILEVEPVLEQAFFGTPALSIELVPQSCWYSNLRSILPPPEWDNIKQKVRYRSGSRCEICGGRGPKWPVETHEEWSYDDATCIQRLSAIRALCPDCHMVKHFGLANVRGKTEEAFQHLQKVNDWDHTCAQHYVSYCFRKWEERSHFTWKIELSLLKEYGFSDSAISDLEKKEIDDSSRSS
jgi:hypothetical protein